MNIRIEIGTNLYLEIENVIYTPAEHASPGYPGSSASVDWYSKDCKFIFGESNCNCPAGLSEMYYDEILEAVEKKLQEDI